MPLARRLSPSSVWLALLVAALTTASCDNTVDPFVETDRYHTIWGYLDTASDTQFVRVIPFRRDVGGLGDPDIDVTVMILEEETQRSIRLRDSIVTFVDGSIGHVFYAPFTPIPGFAYRLDVEGQEGAVSQARTVIPRAESAFVDDPCLFCLEGISQVVTWAELEERPFRVEVWYRFAPFPPTEPFDHVVFTYDEIGTRVEDGWRVFVNLSEDAEQIIQSGPPPGALLGVGMRLTTSDEGWRPPGGVFDEELLVQPGTFSNVEHGYGFFGSVNHYAVEWVLSDLITRRLDFPAPR